MPRTAQQQPEFRTLPVASIYESKTNPRKHFDDAKLAELAASVKLRGVLVPLLVRRNGTPGKYEIIAGARRFRAAKKAELTDVPVRVCKMTDREVLEIQLIENLQREDVHPLEEGQGYSRLLKLDTYTADVIAEKVGKTAAYVYKRLKLLNLIPEAREKFITEKIHLGHAILLCRLEPRDQKKALSECFRGSPWRSTKTSEEKLVSPALLESWIKREIYLDLKSAAFDKTDPELVKKAGPCTTCTKRTGANTELFDDMRKGDTCLDSTCFQAKNDAHLVQIQKKAEDEGAPLIRVSSHYLNPSAAKTLRALPSDKWVAVAKKGRCDHAQRAIVVDGNETGTLIDICHEATCEVHRLSAGNYSRNAGLTAAEQKKQRKEKVKSKIDAAIRRQTLLKAMEAVTVLERAELELIAARMIDRMGHDICGDFVAALGLESIRKNNSILHSQTLAAYADALDDQGIKKFIVGCCLAGELNPNGWGASKGLLPKFAALYNLPVKQIEIDIATPVWQKFDQAEARRAAKDKKTKPKKAAPQAGGAPAQSCRVCGCTEDDCSQCIEKTGEPCVWVEKDLCSACANA